MVKTLLVEGEDGTGSGGLRSYGRIGRDILEPLRMTVHYPRKLFFMEPAPQGDIPPGGVFYETVGRFLLVPVRLEAGGCPARGAIRPRRGHFQLAPRSQMG